MTPSTDRKSAELWIIGTPLTDTGTLHPAAVPPLTNASLIIGESKKQTELYLKRSQIPFSADRLYFLDNIDDRTWKGLAEELRTIKKSRGLVALMSDTGMPILFDPGKDVLDLARSLEFIIRSLPSATSWGSACALSGFSPPFSIHGFLPQNKEARDKELLGLSRSSASIVLLETPYRFKALISQLTQTWNPQTLCFLGWEIGGENERLIWCPLATLATKVEKLRLEKGEFILIIEGKTHHARPPKNRR